MSFYIFTATGRVSELDYERYKYTVLALDARALDQPGLSGSPLRITGEIDEYPIEAAILNSRAIGRYIILSPELLKQARFAFGNVLELRFNLANPDDVSMPEELSEILARTPAALKRWSSLTAGKKRGLAHLVGKPKTSEIRLRKARELCDLLASGAPLPGPPSRVKKKAD